MNEKPVRLGIVGLKQGLEDVYVALHHAGFQLEAVCDREREPYDWITGRARFEDSRHEYAGHASGVQHRMMAAIREHPDAHGVTFFDDYETMLREADIEAVSLMVPDALHAPFAKAALEAGKWVLCTKPMADTLAAAQEIVEAAESRGGRYLMSLPFSYGAFATAVRRVLAEGRIGTPRLIRLDHFRKQFRAVHRSKEVSHGPIVVEGCHYLHLISMFAGDPKFRRLTGFGGLDVHGNSQDIQDNGQVMVEFENGVRGSHAFSYFTELAQSEPLMILGENGILSGNYEQLTLRAHGEPPETIEIEPDPQFPLAHHGGYGPMYEHWHQVIRNGETPRVDARAAFENLLTAHAAQTALDRATVLTRDAYLAAMSLSPAEAYSASPEIN